MLILSFLNFIISIAFSSTLLIFLFEYKDLLNKYVHTSDHRTLGIYRQQLTSLVTYDTTETAINYTAFMNSMNDTTSLDERSWRNFICNNIDRLSKNRNDYSDSMHLIGNFGPWSRNILISSIYSVIMSFKKNYFVTEDDMMKYNKKVLYCYVAKASSTAWKSLIALSQHPTLETSLQHLKANKSLGLITQNYPYIRLNKNVNSKGYSSNTTDLKEGDVGFSFAFVRHPLHRILSAYRSKFCWKNRYFQQRYGDYIKMTVNMGNFINFSSPLTYVKSTSNISLAEFIHFVVNIETAYPKSKYSFLMNQHWAPIVDTCNPCAYNYDFIGKHENRLQDIPYILKRTRWDNLPFNPFYLVSHEAPKYATTLSPNYNDVIDDLKSSTNTQSFRDYDAKDQEIIDQIPNELLKKLVYLFRYDYALFYPKDPLFLQQLNSNPDLLTN